MTKKLGEQKLRRSESRAGPHMNPIFSHQPLSYFSSPPPLIDLTVASHMANAGGGPRYSLRQPKVISFRAPAEHTRAKEIWIIISDWYDGYNPRDGDAKAAEVRDEKSPSRGIKTLDLDSSFLMLQHPPTKIKSK